VLGTGVNPVELITRQDIATIIGRAEEKNANLAQ